MPLLEWKIWIFKAGEEYELPRGCDGVLRRVEGEPGVCEYVVVCPVRISNPQAKVIFKGVSELRHAFGRVCKWCLTKPRLLEFEFQECDRWRGSFDVPVIPPGRPRSSKVKEKDPGPRLHMK